VLIDLRVPLFSASVNGWLHSFSECSLPPNAPFPFLPSTAFFFLPPHWFVTRFPRRDPFRLPSQAPIAAFFSHVLLRRTFMALSVITFPRPPPFDLRYSCTLLFFYAPCPPSPIYELCVPIFFIFFPVSPAPAQSIAGCKRLLRQRPPLSRRWTFLCLSLTPTFLMAVF